MTRSNNRGSPTPTWPSITAQACTWVLLFGSATLAATARAQDGLRAAGTAAAALSNGSPLGVPHWQARFGMASPSGADPSARLQGASLHLLGDYYWQGFRPAGFGLSGGFRATSGLLVGERALSFAPASALSRGQAGSPASARALRLGEAEREMALAVPYFGVGYSGASLRGGWGFTADLGLAGMNGGGLQMRRDAPALSRGVDDILRELRLSPVLQIGASYAF